MPFRVLKPISADDGSTIPTGTLVDAEGWRNLRQLINGRYLGEVVVEEAAEDAPKPKAKKSKVQEEVNTDVNI
jgi:hypothetical protein